MRSVDATGHHRGDGREETGSGGREQAGPVGAHPREHAAEDAVRVEFELTPEEWVEVSIQHHAASATVLGAERRAIGLFVAVVLVGALLGLLSGGVSAALTWLLAGGIGIALLRPLVRRARKKQFAQFASGGITNGLFGHHRVELREDGILNATAGYEWLVRWSAIERVEEGEGAFLVYNGPNSFMVIPHSAFRDAASLRRFADVFFERLEVARARRLEPPSAGATPNEMEAAQEGAPRGCGDVKVDEERRIEPEASDRA